MKEIIDLYKEHINPDPDGAELHNFLRTFNLGSLRIHDPLYPVMEKVQAMFDEKNQAEAKRWILDNSNKSSSKNIKKKLMNAAPSHSPVSEYGQAPIVEFMTIRGNLEESYERNRLMEMGQTPEFACKHDYMTTIVIDMDNVIDYSVGKTYLNGQELEAVYPNMYGMESPPLLCSPEVFKKIYEESRNLKIKSFTEWK